MRIAFLGNDPWSVPTLDALVASVHEVVLGVEGSVGYRLRRLTDGFVLPAVFPEADVRAAETEGRRWTPVGTSLDPDPTELGSF